MMSPKFGHGAPVSKPIACRSRSATSRDTAPPALGGVRDGVDANGWKGLGAKRWLGTDSRCWCIGVARSAAIDCSQRAVTACRATPSASRCWSRPRRGVAASSMCRKERAFTTSSRHASGAWRDEEGATVSRATSWRSNASTFSIDAMASKTRDIQSSDSCCGDRGPLVR